MKIRHMLYALWKKLIDHCTTKTYTYTNLPTSSGNYQIISYVVKVKGNTAKVTLQFKTLKSYAAGTGFEVTFPTIPDGIPDFQEARGFGWNSSCLIIGQMSKTSVRVRPLIVALPANQQVGIISTVQLN